MESTRDKLLESMLQTNNSKTTQQKLIIDLSEPINEASEETTIAPPEMSMLEMMMAAQAEAKKVKEIEQTEAAKKSTKEFGGGFKKGFFGNKKSDFSSTNNHNSNNTSVQTATTTANKNTPQASQAKAFKASIPSPGSSQRLTSDDSKPTSQTSTSNLVSNSTLTSASSTSSSGRGDLPTVRKDPSAKSALVMDEVQTALKGDDSMLAKLQQGEWMTPDLMETFQSNPIIAAGFKNPICMAAMQLMQSNPNEAKKRFQGQPEVELFLKEFGAVMAKHFEGLGATSGPGAASGPGFAGHVGPVTELGPLQAEALKRAK